MIKRAVDKLPIHGYIRTKSAQITDGKSIIERAVLVEAHDYSLSNASTSVRSSACEKGEKDCLVKGNKRR